MKDVVAAVEEEAAAVVGVRLFFSYTSFLSRSLAWLGPVLVYHLFLFE